MGTYRYMGVYRCTCDVHIYRAYTDLWGHTDIWGHTNVQEHTDVWGLYRCKGCISVGPQTNRQPNIPSTCLLTTPGYYISYKI